MTLEELNVITEQIYKFHTKRAPGIPIAVAMVDYALELLGPDKGKLNAVSESQSCLSDVIQVMTGCTIGNRYLKIIKEIGRYAVTLYDRDTGLGARIFIDTEKIDPEQTPELSRFFKRTRSAEVQKGGTAREESGKKIVAEFAKVGRKIFGWERIRMKEFGKPPMLPAKYCADCRQTFLARNEEHVKCDYCEGSAAYYERVS